MLVLQQISRVYSETPSTGMLLPEVWARMTRFGDCAGVGRMQGLSRNAIASAKAIPILSTFDFTSRLYPVFAAGRRSSLPSCTIATSYWHAPSWPSFSRRLQKKFLTFAFVDLSLRLAPSLPPHSVTSETFFVVVPPFDSLHTLHVYTKGRSAHGTEWHHH